MKNLIICVLLWILSAFIFISIWYISNIQAVKNLMGPDNIPM